MATLFPSVAPPTDLTAAGYPALEIKAWSGSPKPTSLASAPRLLYSHAALIDPTHYFSSAILHRATAILVLVRTL
jgi:hypothetical protein